MTSKPMSDDDIKADLSAVLARVVGTPGEAAARRLAAELLAARKERDALRAKIGAVRGECAIRLAADDSTAEWVFYELAASGYADDGEVAPRG